MSPEGTRPPQKRSGHSTGRRHFDGVIKDVAGVAVLLGETQKTVRAQTARGLLPHRRLGGRIVYIESEVLAFLRQLPGVTAEQALANVAARNGNGAEH